MEDQIICEEIDNLKFLALYIRREYKKNLSIASFEYRWHVSVRSWGRVSFPFFNASSANAIVVSSPFPRFASSGKLIPSILICGFYSNMRLNFLNIPLRRGMLVSMICFVYNFPFGGLPIFPRVLTVYFARPQALSF